MQAGFLWYKPGRNCVAKRGGQIHRFKSQNDRWQYNEMFSMVGTCDKKSDLCTATKTKQIYAQLVCAELTWEVVIGGVCLP